jgi:hypothetical protein
VGGRLLTLRFRNGRQRSAKRFRCASC